MAAICLPMCYVLNERAQIMNKTIKMCTCWCQFVQVQLENFLLKQL